MTSSGSERSSLDLCGCEPGEALAWDVPSAVSDGASVELA
jgi:hypothetical protein